MATEAPTTPSSTARPDRERAAHQRLPDGWQHSMVVAWLLGQPRQRRETMFASAFAVTAVLWAPLGILAFLAQVFGIFVAVSALVLVAVAAPRPTLTGIRGALAHAREGLAELGPHPAQRSPRSAR